MIRVGLLCGSLALALVAAGCSTTLPPLGQAVVYIDTDAPLAVAPGAAPAIDEPAPLFDGVRAEILTDTGAAACASCSRTFAVDGTSLRAGLLSFAVVPSDGRALRVRIRMFRRERLRDGQPPPASTVDVTFALPTLPEDGVRSFTAFLPTERLGKPTTTIEALREGKPAARDPVGTKEARACADATVIPGMVCIPGGTFWEQNALASFTGNGTDLPERAVLVRPFYLDAEEVSVGAFRASGLATETEPKRATGTPGNCTFTDAPAENEKLPMTCIPWPLAEAYCAYRGGRLPIASELEFVASGRRSDPYVWGSDRPSCDDAVFSRAREAPLTSPLPLPDVLQACLGSGVGPAVPGSGARDRLVFPWGTVVDLAGNVSEWVRDRTDAEAIETCAEPGFHEARPCMAKTVTERTSAIARGGNFFTTQTKAIATFSYPITNNVPHVGLRCARDR